MLTQGSQTKIEKEGDGKQTRGERRTQRFEREEDEQLTNGFGRESESDAVAWIAEEDVFIPGVERM